MRYKRKHLRSEEPTNIINMVDGKSGVYKIYLLNNRAINRLIGCDESGLLYIGHAADSNGLRKRISDFLIQLPAPPIQHIQQVGFITHT